MLEKHLTPYSRFEEHLAASDEKMTLHQQEVAKAILNAGARSGKSWLIDRLYEFDNLNRTEDHG